MSNIQKRFTNDWPEHLSYDNSDEKIKEFFSEKGGIVTKKDSIFYKKRLIEVFLFAMALGKHNDLKNPLKKKSQSMPTSALQQDEIWLMTSVALSEENSDLNILAKQSEIVKICEEYANGGIRLLLGIHAKKSEAFPLAEYERLLENVLGEHM